MKNAGIYKIAIILLVVLNLGTLIFIWFSRPGREKPGKRPDAAAFLIRELGLNEKQQNDFLLLRQEHMEKLEHLSARDRVLHKRFFDLLLLEPPDTIKARILADSIAAIRKEMEIMTYDHFYNVTKILNPGQQKKFEVKTPLTRVLFKPHIQNSTPERVSYKGRGLSNASN